ncbi:hypothetical protein AX17_004755 [Amanita inopinata Kibby_2008]|nr:hypothetical protein AX17_004755 [Amanita inopinata Kibby_2008]
MSAHHETLLQAIKQDHAEILSYYNEYLKAQSRNDRDAQERWSNQLTWEIARHAVGEEIVVYPLFEKHLGPKGRELADKDLREHQAVKDRLYSLEKHGPMSSEQHSLVLKQIMDMLECHVRVEENQELPLLEESLGAKESRSAAKSFKRTKMFVPTRPHPWAPSKPPFETVVGLLTAPIDKLKDMFAKFPTEEMKREAEAEARSHTD